MLIKLHFGVTQVHNVQNTMHDEEGRGVCTSKILSPERRVRIAAGAIVILGALLAQFVSPAFVWLSGFVGAGLMFAGITDTWAMGMLIAKLPWNQHDADASCTR